MFVLLKVALIFLSPTIFGNSRVGDQNIISLHVPLIKPMPKSAAWFIEIRVA